MIRQFQSLARDDRGASIIEMGLMLPILASPGRESAAIEAQVDPPLGILRHDKRHLTAIDVPAGATLCLFTDGLVERRRVPLDENLDRLRDVVTASHPEVVCRSVLAALLDDQTNPDDVALLVIRRIAQPPSDCERQPGGQTGLGHPEVPCDLSDHASS